MRIEDIALIFIWIWEKIQMGFYGDGHGAAVCIRSLIAISFVNLTSSSERLQRIHSFDQQFYLFFFSVSICLLVLFFFRVIVAVHFFRFYFDTYKIYIVSNRKIYTNFYFHAEQRKIRPKNKIVLKRNSQCFESFEKTI